MVDNWLPEANGADTGGICEYGIDNCGRDVSGLGIWYAWLDV